MRICSQCQAAENPNGRLRFLENQGSVFCENCYSSVFGEPQSSRPNRTISGLDDFVVIKCPDCRGTGVRMKNKSCDACARYGYVRVAKNALPVYVMRPDDYSDASTGE